jgi:hypothetical protein
MECSGAFAETALIVQASATLLRKVHCSDPLTDGADQGQGQDQDRGQDQERTPKDNRAAVSKLMFHQLAKTNRS